MSDLTDILSGKEEQLNEEELLRYINKDISDDERHAIEKKMLNASFENDAVDGLQEIESKPKLDQYVAQLNKNLQQQLSSKKQKRLKRKIDLSWILLSVIVILLLCTLGYLVIHLKNRSKAKPLTSLAIISRQSGNHF